ncbi:hypothetical protein HGA88_01405 [Candidatus Roizmanbacteria bacterium]|nr:hypothetical protein [Candidatus Roizmanbacteria bacterium]
MGKNYTPLSFSPLNIHEFETKHGSATSHRQIKPPLTTLILGLGLLIFISSIGFTLQRQSISTTFKASAPIPTVQEVLAAQTQQPLKPDRDFLKQEVARLGIVIPDPLLLKRFNDFYASPTPPNVLDTTLKTTIWYEIARQEVTKKEVESRTGYILGAWLPTDVFLASKPEEEKAKVAKQRQDLVKMNIEIENQLRQGKILNEIIPALIEAYPLLSGVFSVNGIRYTKENANKLLDYPASYEYGLINLKTPLYNKLFTMKAVETYQFAEDPRYGTGGYLLYVQAVGSSQFKTYNELIEARVP